MKITNIETRLLEAPISGFTGGTYALTHRRTVQCRITTDEGIVTDVCVGNDSSYGPLFWQMIRGPLKDALIGSDPLLHGHSWSTMMREASAAYVDRAEIIKAISTLDIALWDLKGQILQQPVFKLLGGVHNSVPIIAIGGYYESSTTAEGIAQEVQRCKDAGMAGLKFKVGALSLQEDADRVRHVRENAGDDFIIVADSNMAWSPSDALEFIGLVKDLDIAWLEEPVHWRNQLRGLRSLRNGTVPIGAGQSELSVFSCSDLLSQESVDVINVTSNRGGGITGWLKIAGAAELADVRMGHVGEPHISMHLMAGIPNGTYVECYPDAHRDPFWENLYQNRPAILDGHIVLPEEPGLGVTLNYDAVEHYAVSDWAESLTAAAH
jgi:L-alanine-DL-glutamate epimerase-like enolase superfamily enzyme